MNIGLKRLKENIYFDVRNLEVRFINCDGSAEVVNLILTDALGVRRLEFFARDINSRERKEWPVPKQMALNGIQKCLDAARSVDEGKIFSVLH